MREEHAIFCQCEVDDLRIGRLLVATLSDRDVVQVGDAPSQTPPMRSLRF
jgi:hypothetical protein